MFFSKPQLSKSSLGPMPLRESRKLDTAPIGIQPQSPFLSKLPAELRNIIYYHVFTPNPTQPRSTPAHPLSLLLACRQISHEATILAFHVHPFHLAFAAVPSFVLLRNSISHLSTQQKSAITALVFDVGTGDAAEAIANSVLLFPSLRRFKLRAQRCSKLHSSVLAESESLWFYQRILEPFIAGRSFSWQKGEHWSIRWPRLDSGELCILDRHGAPQKSCKQPFLDSNIIEKTPGVYMGVCGCEYFCWLSAILVQESGRTLTVSTIFYESDKLPMDWEEKKYATLKVRLKPGVEPLKEIKEMPQNNFGGVKVTGYAFEADEEYWKELRQRSWTLGSALRGLFSGVGNFNKQNGAKQLTASRDTERIENHEPSEAN